MAISFKKFLLGTALVLSALAFSQPAHAQDALCDDPIETTVGTFTSKADIAASLGTVCVDPEPSNTPPFINNPGNQTSNEDDAVSLQLIGGDAEDLIAWSEVGLPPNLSLNQSGLVTGVTSTEGSYTVTVTVDDGQATDSATFGWTVLANDPPPPTGDLSFVPVTFADAPDDTEPFGVACADFDQDGFMECVMSEHEGSTHTRWEWNGSSFAYKDALSISKCDLDIYAVDGNLDGNLDLFCGYINWDAARFIPYANGDLDTSAPVRAVCGSGRIDNCAPVLQDDRLMTRRGDMFEFDGNKASLVATGYSFGSSSYTQVGGWFVDGVAVDLRGYLETDETVSVKHTKTADFNGDGRIDILMSPHVQSSSDTDSPVLLLQDSAGNFPVASPFPSFSTAAYQYSYSNLDVADIDNDGDVDAVAFGPTFADSIQIFLNDGNGVFTRSDVLSNLSFGPGGGAGGNQDKPAGRIVDFDGDGCLDLVTSQDAGPGQAYLRGFRQNSTGCN